MSEVTTQAGSSDSQSLSLLGDCGRRKSRRELELPTVGSPDLSQESRHRWFYWPAVCARRKSWPSEVPTFVGSSDTDLTQAESPGISGVDCLFNCARRKSRRTSEVPTIGSPDVCREFRHCLAPVDFWPHVNSVFFIRRKSRDLRRNSQRRSERLDFALEYIYPSPPF